MASFTGQLNSNEIFAALYNMIISQQVFADNITGPISSLVDKNRVDGSMYGDTKLYYSTDVLKSSEWGNDAEATNLLKLYRPEAPKCQSITLDVFRQIALTVDDYLSKRAWQDEGAFSQFTSVMKGWIGDTKKVYDATTYNAFIGTATSAKAAENINITKPADSTLGQEVGRVIADLFVKLGDVSRDFNDDGVLRSYSKDKISIIWNSDYVNLINKLNMPILFHNEGLIDSFVENILPARYFGTVLTADGTGDGITKRTLIEKDYDDTHCFPGDIIPNGAAYLAKEAYTEDSKVICKVIGVGSAPYMSGFEVSTSFFNPKSLTETNYLTFGHNTLEYITSKPYITVKEA